MAPITKEPDTLSTQVNETVPAGAKPQPTAAEIPVSVNGARAVAGTDKREPFSENTHTVLVFANGAVIRLSSAVSAGRARRLIRRPTALSDQRTNKKRSCLPGREIQK